MKNLMSMFAVIAGIVGIVAYSVWQDQFNQVPPPVPSTPPIDQTSLVPNWSAIASWPLVKKGTETIVETEASPDPSLVTTVIVLDDSGSMGDNMGAAKQAVIDAIGQMPTESRIAVLALNGGEVLPVMAVSDATRELPGRLSPIIPTGSTPLGKRLGDALSMLSSEATRRRGFGTYRILVTTDGAASDHERLNRAVTRILSTTPIELATIGLGIGEGHALNMPGFTDYVSVTSVEQLAEALRAAAAEQTTFDPITSFGDQ